MGRARHGSKDSSYCGICLEIRRTWAAARSAACRRTEESNVLVQEFVYRLRERERAAQELTHQRGARSCGWGMLWGGAPRMCWGVPRAGTLGRLCKQMMSIVVRCRPMRGGGQYASTSLVRWLVSWVLRVLPSVSPMGAGAFISAGLSTKPAEPLKSAKWSCTERSL